MGNLIKLLNASSRSLVVRLVVFGVFMVLLGFILRVVILLPYLEDRLIAFSSEHQLSIARYVAKDIDVKLGERLGVLDRMAASLPLSLLDDPVGLEAWLKLRHDINPLFSQGYAVIRADGGGVIADYPVLPGRRQLDYRDSDFVAKAVAGDRAVIGRPIRGRSSGEPVLVMAKAVRDQEGKVVAVLSGAVAIAAPGFLNLLQETRIGRTGGFLLISPRDGLFVAATDPAKVLTPLPQPGVNLLHDRAMAGYRGTGTTVNIDGMSELSAIASVPGTGWFLVVRLPVAEALESMEGAKGFMARWTALTTLIVVIGGGLLIRQFFMPLINTSRQIHRMAAGEIELQPLPVIRHDEIGEVAEGFNVLLARLDEVTEQKLASERGRLVEKERIEAMLRQWMADASHELRTPISVLRAQVEAVQDGVFDLDDQRLDLLHREIMGVGRLVEDLFALARSDSGQLDCGSEPIAILGLIEGVVGAFRERFAAAGIAIEGPHDVPDGPIVAGDSIRMRQVFSNLLENTLRYTDSGGRLRLDWSLGGTELTLRLDDTAPGVPAQSMPRLFERFYRVDVSRSRASGGSGLGLCLCQSFIEAHGGTIAVEDSPLGGLGVIIRLPTMERS